MRKFFAGKFAFIAVVFLVTSAFTWDLVHSAGATVGGLFLAAPNVTLLAHSPSVPPDPWDVRLAHAPSVPPDPWDVRLAHAPSVPPDPWDVRLA